MGYYGRSVTRDKLAFALGSIAILALGIGANTAVFSIVNGVLLRPLPYPAADRLVVVGARTPSGDMNNVSDADFQDWRDQSRSLESIAAVTGASFNLTGGDRPEKIPGMAVSSGFFATLGVTPVRGRDFTADEEKPGAPPVVILSDAMWKRRFGGTTDIIGATIRLDDRPRTVIGVMPPGFQFLDRSVEAWEPLTFDESRSNRNFYYLLTVGRLKAGVTLAQARAEMRAIATRLAAAYPKSNAGWSALVVPLRDQLTGDVRPAILLLLGAVSFVLLIACANVANLLLVRAAGRKKEFAIRAALGAGTSRIVRQLLLEAMLLALTGGAAGVLLAHWSLNALVALKSAAIPNIDDIGIDYRVLAFALVVSTITGVVFGLAPAWHASKVDLNEALKDAGRDSGEGLRGRRMRSALVVAEVSLAMVLLIGAGLMIRSLVALETTDPGFRNDHLLTMNVSVQEAQYGSESQMAGDFARVVERARSLPGVILAAAATNLPLGEWNQARKFSIEGRAPSQPDEILAAGYLSVSPEYFRTVGLRLLRGREFTVRDRQGAPEVVVISESMARRYWPDENPIGRAILCASRQFQGHGLGVPVRREIVGVVSDVLHPGADAQFRQEMYTPQLQNSLPFTYFVVRTAGDPERLGAVVSREVNTVLRDSPVAGLMTMEDRLGASFAQPRFHLLLLGVFAGLALLLAAVGLYGVIAYSIAQRTREIGIRMALGAERAEVARWVVFGGLRLATVGIALGMAGAMVCTRLMSGLLYNVRTTDPPTFMAVAGVLLATTALAAYVPARRAARVDPADVLRG